MMFIFHFKYSLKKKQGDSKKFWSFNKSLLVLKDFDGLSKLDVVNMERCTFWVKVHGFP